MTVELRKTFQFEAAHLLPHLPPDHKCRRLHGHSFTAEVVVEGECDEKLGWLIDYAGDDTWIAPGLGLGGGNDNGIGVFVDLRGADTYVVPDGRTFGGANIGDRGAAFESALCLGVFIDADGVDDYEGFEAEALVGNDRDWSWDDRRPEHKPGEHGAGLDVTAGRLSLP